MGGYIASSRAWLIAPSMRVRPRSVSMVAATRSVTVYRESYHVWVSRCVPCVHVCAVLRLTHCIGSYVGCRGCGLHLVYSDTTRTTVKVVHSPSSPRATSHLPSRARVPCLEARRSDSYPRRTHLGTPTRFSDTAGRAVPPFMQRARGVSCGAACAELHAVPRAPDRRVVLP